MTNTPVPDSPSLLLFVSVFSEEVCEDEFSFESDENKQCIAIEFPYKPIFLLLKTSHGIFAISEF